MIFLVWFGCGRKATNWWDGDTVLGEATCGGSAVLHGRRLFCFFFCFGLSFSPLLTPPWDLFLNLKNGAGWRVLGALSGSTVRTHTHSLLFMTNTHTLSPLMTKHEWERRRVGIPWVFESRSDRID